MRTIRTYRLTNSHFNLTVLELSEIRLETLPFDPIQAQAEQGLQQPGSSPHSPGMEAVPIRRSSRSRSQDRHRPDKDRNGDDPPAPGDSSSSGGWSSQRCREPCGYQHYGCEESCICWPSDHPPWRTDVHHTCFACTLDTPMCHPDSDEGNDDVGPDEDTRLPCRSGPSAGLPAIEDSRGPELPSASRGKGGELPRNTSGADEHWSQHWSDEWGRPYWFHVQTGESTWERPAVPTAPMPSTPTPAAPAVPTAPMPLKPKDGPAVPTAPMPSTPTPAAPGGHRWVCGTDELPPNWQRHWSPRYSLPYWFNVQTRESTWERPGTDSASAGTPMQEHPAVPTAPMPLLSRFACRKCNEFYIHTNVEVGGGRFCCKRCDWSNGLEHGWKCEQRPMSWPTASIPVPSTPTPAAPAVPTAPMPSTRTPAAPGGQLPRNWEQHWSHACSLPYWFNVQTGEWTWERPG